jgi:uroporphyrinogen decarboxylase
MMPLVDRFNRISREHGLPALLPGGTPTTLSAAVVGLTNFMKWLIRYPETIHALQRKVTDFLIRTAEITIKKYGADNCSVVCGVPVDSNGLLSPRMFETFSKPYIKEILKYYATAGVTKFTVHLCGDHSGNLAHWPEMPLPPRTVFSVGNEMDLQQTAAFIGKKYIIAGNISTTLLLAGSYDDVFEDTVRCLRAGMNHPGGFILMPACELPPDTPLQNIEAVAHALYEHGYY